MNIVKPLNILAVDDDEMNAEILQINIEYFGHIPHILKDGDVAWEYLNENRGKVDLVLLDLMMPKMNGFELAKKMQSDPFFKNTPIIIQSGKASSDELQEALDAGVLFYLTKPFSTENMRGMIDSVAYTLYREKCVNNLMKNELDTSVEEFEVKTLEDMYDVVSKIARSAPDQNIVKYVLAELILNAIEHGNLNIGYTKKGRIIKEQTWEDEISNLLNKPENANKKVCIKSIRSNDCLEVRILDQGEGFDWKKYKELKAENIVKMNGRGIAKAFKMLPTIDYVGNGNEVHCKFYI